MDGLAPVPVVRSCRITRRRQYSAARRFQVPIAAAVNSGKQRAHSSISLSLSLSLPLSVYFSLYRPLYGVPWIGYRPQERGRPRFPRCVGDDERPWVAYLNTVLIIRSPLGSLRTHSLRLAVRVLSRMHAKPVRYVQFTPPNLMRQNCRFASASAA